MPIWDALLAERRRIGDKEARGKTRALRGNWLSALGNISFINSGAPRDFGFFRSQLPFHPYPKMAKDPCTTPIKPVHHLHTTNLPPASYNDKSRAKKSNPLPNHSNSNHTMSHEGQEELLDYSDSEEIAVSTSVPADDASVAKDADKKGSYVGVHATGFRDFLLKPELLRAIGDCGFEHPSEGSYNFSTEGLGTYT